MIEQASCLIHLHQQETYSTIYYAKGVPMKHWARVVVVWTLLTLLAGIGLYLLLNRPAEVGEGGLVARRVPRRVLVAGDDLPVELRLVSETFPICDSSATRPTDMAFLLDRSGSMEGQPLEEAKRACKTLVEGIDLQIHRLALIPFNSTAQPAQSLTSDGLSITTAIEQLSADNGTAIDQALRAGRQELASSAAAGRRAVILLLSDGGSDLDSALREATQARSAGIEIIAVGLRGDDFDEQVLKAVSGNAQPIILSNPADLTMVFEQLASEVTNPLVIGLSVQELYNTKAFQLADPLLLAAAGNPGFITWEASFVGAANSTRTYSLQARRIGWHQLSPGGQVSMSDCLGNPLMGQMPTGPHVLVILPIPWLLGLWLLPLLLLLLAGFLRPRKRQEAALLDPDHYDSFVPSSYELPGVGTLECPGDLDEPEPARGDPAQCPDVLILGAGDAGRRVLTTVKRNLIRRYGQVPDSVRLLLVDFSAPKRHPAKLVLNDVQLTEGIEALELAPRFGQWRDHSELVWKGDHNLDDPGRVRGRMALATDILGQAGSKGSPIWRAVTDAKRKLGTPAVFVVASLGDEAGSGMAFDLAELARRADDGRDVKSRTLLLGLPTAARGGSLADREQRSRWGVAGLRELRRLFYHHRWRSVYGETDRSPFDGCYLFDGYLQVASDTPHTRNVVDDIDLRAQPEEAGPLSVIADWLTSILDPEIFVAHDSLTRITHSDMRSIASGLHRGLIGAVGACVLNYPIGLLRNRAKWCLLEQTLTLDTTLPRISPTEINDFLRGKEMANHHVLMAWTADLAAHPWNEDGEAGPGFFVAISRKADSAFNFALAERLVQIMNEHKSDATVRATAFLKTLRDKLEAESRKLPRLALPSEEDRSALRQWLEGCLTSVRIAEGELEKWEGALEDLRAWAHEELASVDDCLKSWQRSRTGRLTREILGSAEIDMNTQPELYARLPRIRDRLFWSWNAGLTSLQSCMMIFPMEFDAKEDRPSLEILLEECCKPQSTDAQAFHDKLEALAKYYTRFVLTHDNYDVSAQLKGLLQPEPAKVMVELARESSPLLRYDNSLSSEILNRGGRENVEVHRIVTVRDQNVGQVLRENLNRERSVVTSTADCHACTVLSLASLVPLDTLKAYHQMSREISRPNPDDQVFLVERVLADWERRALGLQDMDPLGLEEEKGWLYKGAYGDPFVRRSSEPLFHPEFGSKVGDGRRAEQFAQAAVWDIITVERQGWVLTLEDGRTVLGASAISALEAFVSAPSGRPKEDLLGEDCIKDSLEKLTRAIESRRSDGPSDVSAYLKERLIMPSSADLYRSSDFAERSLWNLMRLMAEESV